MQVSFPQANDGIATCDHVCILRGIKSSASLLSWVERGELERVAMPVISVKLHDGVLHWQKSIDTELLANHFLWLIGDIEAIKQGIAYSFKLIRLAFLLLGVHLPKAFLCDGVLVAACQRTIFDFVQGFTRGRPLKRLAAYRTYMRNLGTRLPFVRMFKAAKVVFSLLQASFGQIDCFATERTGHFLAVLACTSFAGLRAKTFARIIRRLKGLSTGFTWSCKKAARKPFAGARTIGTPALCKGRWRTPSIKFFLAYRACFERTSAALGNCLGLGPSPATACHRTKPLRRFLLVLAQKGLLAIFANTLLWFVWHV